MTTSSRKPIHTLPRLTSGSLPTCQPPAPPQRTTSSRRQLTAVAAAGFEGLSSAGGTRPDGLVLQASGASRFKLRHPLHSYNAARGFAGGSTCAAITRTANLSPHRGP